MAATAHDEADDLHRRRCLPKTGSGCPIDQQCSSIYASLDPVATHLGCTPIGTRGLGDTCSLVTTWAGIHDNCGPQLVCVAGTCRQVCAEIDGSCSGCSYAPGLAPESAYCNGARATR